MSTAAVAAIRREARSLAGLDDVAPIVEAIGDARLVLLGEATHGSFEFYRLRTRISQRLIEERGFDALAVEADWPDALRVSRYVQGGGADRDALAALAGFRRFPRWMWRNHEILELVTWLRRRNRGVQPARRAGFFGLDLYSLGASLAAVIAHLDRVDPPAAARARQRYACFDAFGDHPQYYGYATTFGLARDCEEQVLTQLVELSRQPGRHFHGDGAAEDDERFYARQNALVVKNAEAYYRAMFADGHAAWNLRDTHMADTLEALLAHLEARLGRPARVVVWAHNSHLGDARATSWALRGQINLGQLVRERGSAPAFTLGFTTHQGSVAAASDWDEPVEHKALRPSRPDSVERLLHDSGLSLFLLPLTGRRALSAALQETRLERAVGVIYRPETELASHYFGASLPGQFDAVLHVDRSHALRPLDAPQDWERSEEAETFPTGV